MKKKPHGFSFSINMANFEEFRRTKKLISNLFFLKSDNINRNQKRPLNQRLVYTNEHIYGIVLYSSKKKSLFEEVEGCTDFLCFKD